MRLYLDDDTASSRLARLLRHAAHDVQVPADVGIGGVQDAVHLTHAILDHRTCVTRNHDDFWILHNLIRHAQGHHPGIFVVRQDNDPTRDLSAKGIVTAIRNLERAAVPIADEFVVLNHWR